MMSPHGFHNLFSTFLLVVYFCPNHYCPYRSQCFLYFDISLYLSLAKHPDLFPQFQYYLRIRFPYHKHNFQHILTVIQNKIKFILKSNEYYHPQSHLTLCHYIYVYFTLNIIFILCEKIQNFFNTFISPFIHILLFLGYSALFLQFLNVLICFSRCTAYL